MQPEYFLGFLVSICLAMGIFAVNDYYDFGIDTFNRRYDRPLARGGLQRKMALRKGLYSC